MTLLHPNIAESVEKQQQNQQKYHDSANSKLREFKRHDAVQVKNFLGGTEKWKYGVVVKRLGPLNYLVKLGNQTKKIHVDHMLLNSSSNNDLKGKDITEDWDFVPVEVPPRDVPPELSPSDVTPSTSINPTESIETRRYPQRTHRPVKR